MKASQQVEIVAGDYLETLRRCGGYYYCPKDAQGKRLGPVVGYAGKYLIKEGGDERLQYVGDEFANFAMAEEFPQVLDQFAKDLAAKVKERIGEIDYVLAAPMGGLALGKDISRHLDCRYGFSEKKITALATETLREQSEMQMARHTIEPGWRVLLVEDVCNNFSTTKQMIEMVAQFGSQVVGVACALNRSVSIDDFQYEGQVVPVIPLVRKIMLEYRQDDPVVAEDIKSGNVILKPKNKWGELMAIGARAAVGK